MFFKKIGKIVFCLIIIIFVMAGFETLREEARDQKLKKKLATQELIHLEKNLVFSAFSQEETIKDDVCFFTAKVATYIDHILYRGSKNSLRKPAAKSFAKSISVTALPLCLFSDAIHYSVRGLFETANSEIHFQKAKRCALGLIAFPSGIVYPDLVSQHFVANVPTCKLIQPYGKLYSAKSLQLYPKTYEDVATIIQEARKVGCKVSFAGALLSQGKQALPPSEKDLIIHFDHLNQVVIDPKTKSARVGAGALWKDLQQAANQHGLAVKVMQASNIFSIGGSLSINCHGWDHNAGTLKDTVLSLLIVDSQGKIQRLYPEDEHFDLVIGGLGGFGAILEARISLTANSKMSLKNKELATEDYLSYFQKEVVSNPHIGMHYFRLSLDPKHLFESGIALNYVEEKTLPVISSLKKEPERGDLIERIELGILRRLDWALPIAWKIEKKSALKDIQTDRNEAMTFPLKCIFNETTLDVEWLQEYFVKGRELNNFISYLRETLKENQVAVYNASVRYVKKNESAGFSYSKDEDMFAIVIFFNQSLLPSEIQKTRLWVQSVVDYLSEHEGAYYCAYQHFATVPQFRSCYPEWKRVMEKKQKYDPDRLFTNGFYEEYLFDNSDQIFQNPVRTHFHSVFADPVQREWVKDFMQNVFIQLDTEKFFTLVDQTLASNQVLDEDIYRTLSNKIDESSFSFIKKTGTTLKSLNALKTDLSDQVQELIGDRPINGYVEIGYPGRLCRPLKKKLNLKGPIYVINDKEQLADYIESGFPRPYNRFVYLNDYEQISYKDIPSNSVDLVGMYIGLHHIPQQKIVPFIQSIHRILKPGGSFILMDHDATGPERKAMLSVIHSIFNLGTSVPFEEEVNEIRNFQSLNYWETLLEEQGFVRDPHPPLIRNGDATLNSLIRFTKKATSEEEFQAQIHAVPGYVRESTRTYLTAVEWHNVRATEGYYNFIKNTPFYEFPWFEEIKNMWSVFGKSWHVAREKASLTEVLFSDCTIMSVFINSMTTLEYFVKGLVSLPLSWIYTSESLEDARRLHLLVKTEISNFTHIDSRIQVEHELPNSNLIHLTLPRYMEMFELLLRLSQEDLTYVDIAGQKTIQVDLCIKKGDLKHFSIPSGCRILYEIPATADPLSVFLAMDVEVEHLNQALRNFLDRQIKIIYIHDF